MTETHSGINTALSKQRNHWAFWSATKYYKRSVPAYFQWTFCCAAGSVRSEVMKACWAKDKVLILIEITYAPKKDLSYAHC